MRREIEEIRKKMDELDGVSISGLAAALEAAAENDYEGVCIALEGHALVGGEELHHPYGSGGKDYWEVIYGLLDLAGEEDDEEVVLEMARDIWADIFHLRQAGVDAVIIVGACGFCDEFHFYVASPKAQVETLLERVADGDILNVDVPGLRVLPGVHVDVREEETCRVGNSAGGWYSHYERAVTVVVNRSDGLYNGVYNFVDSVFDAPSGMGGNSGQVRDLAPTWKGW